MAERTKPDLVMNWSRTEDMPVVRNPNADAKFLTSFLSHTFLEELLRRGYDLKTFRFSVRKAKDGVA